MFLVYIPERPGTTTLAIFPPLAACFGEDDLRTYANHQHSFQFPAHNKEDATSPDLTPDLSWEGLSKVPA